MNEKPHLLQGVTGRHADTTRPAVVTASATFQNDAFRSISTRRGSIPCRGIVSPASLQNTGENHEHPHSFSRFRSEPAVLRYRVFGTGLRNSHLRPVAGEHYPETATRVAGTGYNATRTAAPSSATLGRLLFIHHPHGRLLPPGCGLPLFWRPP